MLTRYQLIQLRFYARSKGDNELQQICTDALRGSPEAIDECARELQKLANNSLAGFEKSHDQR